MTRQMTPEELVAHYETIRQQIRPVEEWRTRPVPGYPWDILTHELGDRPAGLLDQQSAPWADPGSRYRAICDHRYWHPRQAPDAEPESDDPAQPALPFPVTAL